MTTSEFVVVGIAVLVASFAQIIAGFGFALLCMPIMTLAVDVRDAVVVSTLVGMVSISWQAWVLRADADREVANRLCIGAVAGMPLGIVVLRVMSDQSLRLILGCAVIIATLMLIRRINLTHAGARLDLAAGFLSGVLNTSLSTNGPPLVFTLQARQFDADRFRGTLVRVFAVSNVVTLAMFSVTGVLTAKGAVGAAVALPAWAAGTALGWPIRARLSGEPFRRLVIALLFVVGLAAIWFALAR